jgi:hypothetical protein
MAISNTDIENAAKAPKVVEGQEGKIEEKPVSEVIAAQNHIDQRSATGPPFGMRVSRTKPGGTVQ